MIVAGVSPSKRCLRKYHNNTNVHFKLFPKITFSLIPLELTYIYRLGSEVVERPSRMKDVVGSTPGRFRGNTLYMLVMDFPPRCT